MNRSLLHMFLAVVLVTSWSSPVSADEPLSRAEIGKLGKAATALVEIKAKKSFGTAFCVHASGLFLTNAHVCEENDKVTLVLDAGTSTQRVLAARVVRRDAKLDLALLRIETKEVQKDLPSLRLGTDADLAELTELVAFGYPFGTALALGSDEYPAVSVNVGNVTSLRRKGRELYRIQLDAALNPGNSGGPVLDRQGRVVGIVVSGVRGSGVNLAIPVSHASTFLARPELQFTLPRVTLANAHEPAIFKATADSLLPDSKPLSLDLILATRDGKSRRFPMKLLDGTYQATAAALPGSPNPGVLRLTLEFAGGTITGTTADQTFKLNAADVKLSAIRSLRMGTKALAKLHDGKTLEGALSGLDALTVDLGGQTVALGLRNAVELRLSPRVEADAVDCTIVATRDGVEVARATDRIVLNSAGASVTASADVPAGEGRIERSLPAAASDLVVGGGGRYLILHLPTLRQLAVFDVNEAKVVKYLPALEDGIKFAAGMEKLVVVMPASNVIQRWSLTTFERELAIPFDFDSEVKAVCLGSASRGPVLIGGERNHSPRLAFFDLDSLKASSIAKSGQGHIHLENGVFVRASADGKVFGIWRTHVSPSGLQTLVLAGNEAKGYYDHTSVGHVIPGPDGKVIYTARGMYTAELKRLGTSQGFVLPAQEGNFYLTVQVDRTRPETTRPAKVGSEVGKGSKITVHMTGDDRPLFTLTDVKLDEESNRFGRDPFGLDRRLHFLPSAKRLVWIPATRDRLILSRFDVEEALEKSGIDYLLVTSRAPTSAIRGESFIYQMAVKAKKGDLRYRVESGPPGMTVSATGKVEWSVPSDFSEATTAVILSVRDETGQECFHTFTLNVRGS